MDKEEDEVANDSSKMEESRKVVAVSLRIEGDGDAMFSLLSSKTIIVETALEFLLPPKKSW